MADYADIPTVKTILEITGTAHDTRLALLNTVASRELERACGVTAFGDEGDPAVITIRPDYLSHRLILPRAVRSVATVTVDGAALTDYRLIWPIEPDRYGGLELTHGGVWYGDVAITAQWSDLPSGTAPEDLVEAANILVSGYFRRDHASDGEVAGPDGLTFRPGNPWQDPRVARFVDAFRVARPVVI
jgi:hypothetical protein